jgi:acid phosphatase (class A)
MHTSVVSRAASLFSAGIIALAIAAQSLAADSNVYLPAGSVDGVSLIGPPAPKGSAAFAEQMAIVLWLQRTRTPDQVAFVSKELTVERFAPVLGEDLMAVDGVALKQTIDAAIDEVRDDYDAVKAVYDVPRPFQVNPDVKPVGQDVRPVASYPSGHAIRATVYGRLLAEVFPDKKDELTTLAEQIGYGRVIAGVHYPEDIVAGQKLGNAYADVIVRQPSFKEAVVRIRDRASHLEAAQ